MHHQFLLILHKMLLDFEENCFMFLAELWFLKNIYASFSKMKTYSVLSK